MWLLPSLCSGINLYTCIINFFLPRCIIYYFLLADHKVHFIDACALDKSIFWALSRKKIGRYMGILFSCHTRFFFYWGIKKWTVSPTLLYYNRKHNFAEWLEIALIRLYLDWTEFEFFRTENLSWIDVLDWIGINRIESDLFSTNLHRTRFKTFFEMIWNSFISFVLGLNSQFRLDRTRIVRIENLTRINASDWIVINRMESNLFLTNLYRTRFNTFFGMTRNSFNSFVFRLNRVWIVSDWKLILDWCLGLNWN